MKKGAAGKRGIKLKKKDELEQILSKRIPTVLKTGFIKAFKLISIAGAYWHGDEKNKMLQSIHKESEITKKKMKYTKINANHRSLLPLFLNISDTYLFETQPIN